MWDEWKRNYPIEKRQEANFQSIVNVSIHYFVFKHNRASQNCNYSTPIVAHVINLWLHTWSFFRQVCSFRVIWNISNLDFSEFVSDYRDSRNRHIQCIVQISSSAVINPASDSCRTLPFFVFHVKKVTSVLKMFFFRCSYVPEVYVYVGIVFTCACML